MKTIQFKVTLLSDVILSQTSKTTGNKKTLDFIPGNVFLGITAKSYKDFGTDQLTVFHSPKVKFSDAHPLVNGVRALRTPAAFHKPKHREVDNSMYVHHIIKDFSKVMNLQLKQQRNDFYAFVDNKAIEYKAGFNFAIKSAYDRKKRRSMDEQMYGYQSLEQGAEYCFNICISQDVEDRIVQQIKDKLIGKHTVGRSRTAQYGLVEIKEEPFTSIQSNYETINDTIIIYAESRLILQDKYGNPTFIPQAEHFGIEGGEYCPEMSQIRTFSYSPFNFHRATFDNERKGIEKGSIIIFKGSKIKKTDDFVGFYTNEGFGKVIFNPHFFIADDEGRSTLQFIESDKRKNNIETPSTDKDIVLSETDKDLLKYLKQAQQREADEKEVYLKVNEFVRLNASLFRGDQFASQWGTIRSLAMQYPTYVELEKELFTKQIERNKKMQPNAYLTHGVAKEKWDERNRRKQLQDFFKDIKEHMIQFAIINLASEMAKKSEGK